MYETLRIGSGSGLLISMIEKTQLDSFEQSNNTGAIDVKMDSSVLKEKSSFGMLGLLSFSSTFDCGSYIISIIKTVFKKSGALIRFIKFLSSEVTLYPYKSTLWSGIESYYV